MIYWINLWWLLKTVDSQHNICNIVTVNHSHYTLHSWWWEFDYWKAHLIHMDIFVVLVIYTIFNRDLNIKVSENFYFSSSFKFRSTINGPFKILGECFWKYLQTISSVTKGMPVNSLLREKKVFSFPHISLDLIIKTYISWST